MNDSEGVTWLQPDHDAEPVGVAVEEYSGYRFMNLPVVIDAALIHGMFEIRSSRLFMLPNI